MEIVRKKLVTAMIASRRCLTVAPLMLGAVLLANCSRSDASHTSPPDPAKALARTLSIIRSATPEHPRVLRILFYGQSISTRRWTDQAVERLRSSYPNVRFDYQNLAIGGWSAAILERSADRDIASAYPDLIVFHVYGDHRAYERIIRTFRSKTAADVIIQTDHVVTWPEPLCDSGLHLRWTPSPGCKGHLWFKQNVWEDFMSSYWLPELAGRYQLALEPRRRRWANFLRSHHLQPAALIADTPHPNAQGWALMARLFTSWFEHVVASPKHYRVNSSGVTNFPLPKPGVPTSYSFIGNRFELISSGPMARNIRVNIDGKSPRDIDGCWQNTRVSGLPNIPEWPALKRVSVDPSVHKALSWSATLSNFDPEQKDFTVLLKDSTGNEITGTSRDAISIKSNHMTIDPQDWTLSMAKIVSGKEVPSGTIVRWGRFFACGAQKPVELRAGQVEQRYLVATGLPNSPHKVILTIPSGYSSLREIRAYRPSLNS